MVELYLCLIFNVFTLYLILQTLLIIIPYSANKNNNELLCNQISYQKIIENRSTLTPK